MHAKVRFFYMFLMINVCFFIVLAQVYLFRRKKEPALTGSFLFALSFFILVNYHFSTRASVSFVELEDAIPRKVG